MEGDQILERFQNMSIFSKLPEEEFQAVILLMLIEMNKLLENIINKLRESLKVKKI